ncbi:hypothetical protein SAMN02910456_01407 [Ruminococcaceae bacterium YRB3002]|nr:hypothetical protein SAMN02910456_01407 [Ruminococcaceae bacterium YRB3002]
MSVSLFGADGLPDSPDRIMGSIFAVLAAQYIGGFENLIMVSPTHVPFEGTLKDKKTMTGRSVATWHGDDIPFVTADFSKVKAGIPLIQNGAGSSPLHRAQSSY